MQIQSNVTPLKTQDSLKLQKAFIDQGQCVFESPHCWKEVFQHGFFLLKIPDYIDITPGIKLGSSFYKDTRNSSDVSYFGFKAKEGIYFDREHFQTEHILLDQKSQAEFFPKELNILCAQMHDIGVMVLKWVLSTIGLPDTYWEHATCGSIDNKGVNWFACSHYRSELARQGCAAHQDTGYITVLYVDQPGLQALVKEKWLDVDPENGYFIINFGASLEILTQHTHNPVKSILHRVKRMEKSGSSDRFSFAAFLNPPSHLFLQQYWPNGSLTDYMLVEKFLDNFNKEVWKDRHEKFGIKQENT